MVSGELLGPQQPDPQDPQELNIWRQVGQQEGVTALEAKALYVIGLVRHLAEAAGKCIHGDHVFWLPAYVLAADAADLLGRCRLGHAATENARKNRQRLEAGFQAILAGATSLRGSGRSYTVDDLITLRNFTMHGSGTPKGTEELDDVMIRALLNGLADEIDRYWNDLVHTSGEKKKLARAGVKPLTVSGRTIHVTNVLELVRSGNSVGTSLLFAETWRGRP